MIARLFPFSRLFVLPCLGLLLLLSACAAQPMSVVGSASDSPALAPAAANPPPGQRIGPKPPIAYPDPMGGVAGFALLDGVEDALACLADGQPVFAVMQRNANVRNRPSEESCRLGRAPAGTLVRVEAVFGQGENAPFAALDRSASLTPASIPGYAQDIQPIFEKNCSSCHSDLVQQAELQVTDYDRLLAGSKNGPVVVPGDPDASKLWLQIRSGAMPLIGELSDDEKALIYDWILTGASQQGTEKPAAGEMWLKLSPGDYTPAPNDCAQDGDSAAYVNAGLARAASCAALPNAEQIATYLPVQQSASRPSASAASDNDPPSSAPNTSAGAQAALPLVRNAPSGITARGANIQAAPLGLGAPSEADPWLIPRGGFCAQQYLAQKLQDRYSITSLAFAPDGRLFIGLDILATGDFDPIILFDPYHPSRTLAVWDSVSQDSYNIILQESSRITGMAWQGGSLYLNRAGEVGRIPDGGRYQRLAAGFAVNGRLFHANNGLAISNGWLYVAAGGVRDGYSDGTIVPGDGDVPAETLATNVAAGGNRFSARIVRAPLDRLLSERTLGVFQTAARGVRNPYGIAADPSGRVWFTDNGATNVPGEYSAGDEVNLLDPRALAPAAVAGDENAAPFYGFPMALGGVGKDWWTGPVLPLPNTAAPTGITWAYGTVFFAQYGRDPGLYRLGNANGQIVAERVMLGWPIQAVTTAPDGAVWVGTGSGGLFRIAPGCGG